MLTVTTSKITGNPSNEGWVQVHEFVSPDPERLKQKGRFFAVISLKGERSDVLSGREILSRLHEEYFGKQEGKVLQNLKAGVAKVISEFKYLGKVEVAAGVYLEGIFYSAAAGGATISIFREGMLATILQSEEGSVISASGFPKEGDIILLSTDNFTGTIPQGVIKAALLGPSLDSIVEALTPMVLAKEGSSSLGVIFLKFGEKDLFAQEPKDTLVTNRGIFAKLNFLKEKVSAFIFKIIPNKRIYVGKETSFEARQEISQSKKMYITTGVILLALLIISIIFGIRQKNIKEQKSRYISRLTQAQHELEEANSLMSLNPERARELFVSSKTTAEALTKEGVKDPALSELVSKIESSQGSILGEYNVDPQLYLDLDLLSSGFVGDDIASSGEVAFVLDTKNKRIVSFEIETKKAQVVAGSDQIASPIKVASYNNRAFILEESGIFEVGDTRETITDKEWEADVLPYFYAGNLYLLGKSENSIWRYSAIGAGFSQKQDWLGKGVNPNFSEVVSITIDGSIWTLSSTGRIQKFSQGSPQAYQPEGVFPALSGSNSIYTNENLKYLYFLDSKNSRIVVLDKEGLYKAQYISDKLSEASDLVVSESAKNIVFLSASKLYSIKIKHL